MEAWTAAPREARAPRTGVCELAIERGAARRGHLSGGGSGGGRELEAQGLAIVDSAVNGRKSFCCKRLQRRGQSAATRAPCGGAPHVSTCVRARWWARAVVRREATRSSFSLLEPKCCGFTRKNIPRGNLGVLTGDGLALRRIMCLIGFGDDAAFPPPHFLGGVQRSSNTARQVAASGQCQQEHRAEREHHAGNPRYARRSA